jgi:hypothetical protein
MAKSYELVRDALQRAGAAKLEAVRSAFAQDVSWLEAAVRDARVHLADCAPTRADPAAPDNAAAAVAAAAGAARGKVGCPPAVVYTGHDIKILASGS